MSRALEAERQQALVRAITGQGEASGLAAIAGIAGGARRGLQAYRGNARAVAARALAAVFARIEQALGEEDFAAMAWAFWRARPPQRGDLACWGQDLPEFLASQDGMPEALVDCARIEWAAYQAERAADSELDAVSLQALAELDAGELQLLLRPGLSLLNVLAEAARRWPAGPAALSSEGQVLPLLVWRRQWKAETRVLDPAQGHFMQALLDGATLRQALEETMNRHAGFDFAVWLQLALTEAWLLGAVRRASKEHR